MALTSEITVDLNPGSVVEPVEDLGRSAPARPAAAAAARVDQAWLALAALGLASALFVIGRLVETWRVTPTVSAHHISLLGQKLSYPVANFAALVVLGLALVGLIVTGLAIVGCARELFAAQRFARWVGTQDSRHLGDVVVIPDEQPVAFCAGLFRPRVYLSSGALAALDQSALRAVVAHERHHALRHDPLRLAAGRSLSRALFFLPGLGSLVRRQQELAELGADERAIHESPDGSRALARAMLAFSQRSISGDPVGIDSDRVDHLLGDAPSWRFPILLSLAGLVVIAVTVAVAVLAGQVAAGSATLAPPLLSSQPCVVVLALIPTLLGLGAVRLRSR